MLPFGILCYPLLPRYAVFPSVTLCYRLLPYVTLFSPLLPFVTLCYHLFPSVTLCSPLFPCVTLCYPLFPCVTLCFLLVLCVTLCYQNANITELPHTLNINGGNIDVSFVLRSKGTLVCISTSGVFNRTSPSLLHTFVVDTVDTQLSDAIQHNSYLHQHMLRKRLQASSCLLFILDARNAVATLRICLKTVIWYKKRKNALWIICRLFGFYLQARCSWMKFVFLSQGNMDQFSMLLDHDADPSMGLDKTGRNLLHLLATMCTEHDLRRHMKIVLKKVRNTKGNLKKYISKKKRDIEQY